MTTLFFDLDGTLLDTQAGIADAIITTLFRLGKANISNEQLRECFGPPIRESFARLLNTRDNNHIAAAVSEFRHYYLTKGIYNYQVYPGVLALLQQLSAPTQQPIRLRVLTIKPQHQAEKLLDHSGLATFFDNIHGSENCGGNSDKSSHLGSILQHEPILKTRCWLIGDRASDIHAAKTNQARSVAACWGYGDPQELSEAGSDHHISKPLELLPLLLCNL